MHAKNMTNSARSGGSICSCHHCVRAGYSALYPGLGNYKGPAGLTSVNHVGSSKLPKQTRFYGPIYAPVWPKQRYPSWQNRRRHEARQRLVRRTTGARCLSVCVLRARGKWVFLT